MYYFDNNTFKFLRALARNNNREWFHANKTKFDAQARDPFLHLIADLQPILTTISPLFRADPKPVSGSLFRIQRDTRFSANKTPYKTWLGGRLFHERSRERPAPSFYLHIEPKNCFVGAGLWHPEPAVARSIRQFIIDNPTGWTKATRSTPFRKRFTLDDSEMLVRPPRDVAADHPLIDDLRHKNFVGMRSLDDDIVIGNKLLSTLEKDLKDLAPLVDCLCAALDLEF